MAKAERVRKIAFREQDFHLAYLAASAALRINPGLAVCLEMASLTRTVAECIAAVQTMRDAREHDRVTSALNLLRDYRKERP